MQKVLPCLVYFRQRHISIDNDKRYHCHEELLSNAGVFFLPIKEIGKVLVIVELLDRVTSYIWS